MCSVKSDTRLSYLALPDAIAWLTRVSVFDAWPDFGDPCCTWVALTLVSKSSRPGMGGMGGTGVSLGAK